jgi:hypothetical protein
MATAQVESSSYQNTELGYVFSDQASTHMAMGLAYARGRLAGGNRLWMSRGGSRGLSGATAIWFRPTITSPIIFRLGTPVAW